MFFLLRLNAGTNRSLQVRDCASRKPILPRCRPEHASRCQANHHRDRSEARRVRPSSRLQEQSSLPKAFTCFASCRGIFPPFRRLCLTAEVISGAGKPAGLPCGQAQEAGLPDAGGACLVAPKGSCVEGQSCRQERLPTSPLAQATREGPVRYGHDRLATAVPRRETRLWAPQRSLKWHHLTTEGPIQ